MPDLTPEERERIYQEEKARIEAQAQLAAGQEKEKAAAKAKAAQPLVWGCLGTVVLMLGFCAYVLRDSTPSKPDWTAYGKKMEEANSAPQAAPAQIVAAVPPLELQSFRWSEEVGYVTVEGSVKNVSSEALKNVQVLGLLETKDGTLVTTAQALIDYNPILSGQVSPFKALVTHNPEMVTCRIEFKDLLGGKIEHSMKPKPPPKAKKK